ncbi:hypothetical protein BU17DRAFT_45776 [Hysterangium stoloniferum]|nr:hypothetical protein BU17DRAFT_45776 [Hysterangium stoloniferum]
MDPERELMRLWGLVSDIMDQLNHNKTLTSKLQLEAAQLRENASHTTKASTLRRFNTDISKEAFSSELERLSVALVMENQTLLHENKQLNSLLQEYQQTLGSVVAKFRGHTHAAQTHESTLSKHYEALLSRDRGEDGLDSYGLDPSQLNNLAALTRAALRSFDGKDPQDNGEANPEEEETVDDEDGPGDWAIERERGILRLEQENAELRKALGISPSQDQEHGIDVGDKIFASQPSPLPRSSPLRDDRPSGRGGSRVALGSTRRLGVPNFNRRGPGATGAAQERVMSPPNDVEWKREASGETGGDSF